MSYEWRLNDEANFGTADNTNVVIYNLNTKEKIKSKKYDNGGGYSVQNYEDLIYLDLNTLHNPDSSFTLEFSVKEFEIDLTKPVNYITFGYQIRNKSGLTITVGRAFDSDRVVIGTITENATDKSAFVGEFPTLPNVTYKYTLVYNNHNNDKDKIKLFRGYDLIATSESMNEHNFSIVDRKLFIGTSAWTNEVEWESMFDIAKIQITQLIFYSNITIDNTFIEGSPDYPAHYSIENVSSDIKQNLRLSGIDDVIHVNVHSSRAINPSTVFMSIDNSNVLQKSVNENFVINDALTTLYTFEFQVRNDWPSHGLLSYSLDFNGNIFNNITISDQLFVDTEPPSMTYSILSAQPDVITVQLDSLTDQYLTFVDDHERYSMTFFASNNSHIKSNIYTNPSINTHYTITDLISESYYYIYATVTDTANNTSDFILPTQTSIIQTSDNTVPVISLGSQYDAIRPIKDSESYPGVRTTINVYDTASSAEVPFGYYIAIFAEPLSPATIYEGVVSHYIHHEQKTNNTPTITIDDLYEFTDTDMSKKHICVEKVFHIYFVAIDAAFPQNKTYLYQTIKIDNTIFFDDSFAQNSTPMLNVATLNHSIILNWNSEYYTYASNYQVQILDDIVVPTSDNGLTWSASIDVDSHHTNGLTDFNVIQIPDLGETSQFHRSDTDIKIWIQNTPPLITGCVLSATITDIIVNDIHNNIVDNFIIEALYPFKLSVYAKQDGSSTSSASFVNEYTSITELQEETNANLTLSGLEEKTLYNIHATLSNVFMENVDMLIGTMQTISGDPEITIIAQFKNINNVPIIEISNNSTVYDANSTSYFYLEVSDRIMTESQIIHFFQNTPGISKTGVNVPAGSPTPINNYLSSNHINKFWKYNTYTSSYIKTDIVPSNIYTYYVYGLVNDGNTNITTMYEVNMNFNITSNPTLSNLNHNVFIRTNDVLEITWQTDFISVNTDFDIILMNINLNNNIETVDQINWKTTHTIDQYNNYDAFAGTVPELSIQYLNQAAVSNYYNNSYIVDIDPPEFSLSLVSTGIDSITFEINSLSDVYTGDLDYTIDISASNSQFGSSNTIISTNYTNIQISTFTIDNLYEGAKYNVSATLTDPASNVASYVYNLGNTVKTVDVTKPVLTVDAASIIHSENQDYISCSNIMSYDKHSEFSTYSVLFDQNIAVTPQDIINYKNTPACIQSENHPASSEYVQLQGNISAVVTYNESLQQWNTYTSEFEYNRDYYLFTTVKDVDDNFPDPEVIIVSVTLNNGPFYGTLDPIDEMPDDTGISVNTIIRIAFTDVLNEETNEVSYLGQDLSGNDNHIMLKFSENPLVQDAIVNTYSLNLQLITQDVILTTKLPSNISFSYSMWFKVTDQTTEIILLSHQNINTIVVQNMNTVIINTNMTQYYPFDVKLNTWTHLTLLVYLEFVEIYMNGEMLQLTNTIGSTFTKPTGTLTLKAQPNILVDDIRIYESTLDSIAISKLISVSGKLVHLSFDSEGDVFDFDVTFKNKCFYLNDKKNPELVLRKGGIFSFYQTNIPYNVPLLFSESGTYESLYKDSLEFEYFIDDVSIGNNPLDYIMNFNKGVFRNKVVVYPFSLTNFYYNTMNISYSKNTITINPYEHSIINYGNKELIPTFNKQPLYTNNTPIGNYALELQSDKQMSISVNTLDLDLNNSTFSAWINLNNKATHPIMTQQNIFEFGINSDNQIYLDITNNDNIVNFISSVDSFELSDSIKLENIQMNRDGLYVYFFASTTSKSKLEVMQLVDQYKSSDIFNNMVTVDNSTPITGSFDHIYDIDHNLVTVSFVDNAFIYISVRGYTSDFAYSKENDFREYIITGDPLSPKITLEDTQIDFEQYKNISVGAIRTYNQLPIDFLYIIPFQVQDSESTNTTSNYDISILSGKYIVSGKQSGFYSTIYASVNETIVLNVSTEGHPLWIKSTRSTGVENAVHNVVNNGSENGQIIWTPTTTGVFYYQCEYHSNMNGVIHVSNMKVDSFDSNLINTIIDLLPTDLSFGINSVHNGSNNIYKLDTNAFSPHALSSSYNVTFESALQSTNQYTEFDMDGNYSFLYIYSINNTIYYKSSPIENKKVL